MPISQTEAYFENPYYRFLEEPMLFLLALNDTSKKKFFPVLRQKPTKILLWTLLKGATIHIYCLFDGSHFSNICTIWYVMMECIELSWLRKHIKKVRSSQAAIPVPNWVKQNLSLSVSLMRLILGEINFAQIHANYLFIFLYFFFSFLKN